jgi:hypothetical protein
MPYQILDSNMTNNAKIAFLHLWKDAFEGNKRQDGRHCSDIKQKELAAKMGKTNSSGGMRTAQKAITELNMRQVIESKKQKGNKLSHYFLAKHRWILT